MKKLLLLWFFSGSLSAFSQVYKIFPGKNGDPDTMRVDAKLDKIDTGNHPINAFIYPMRTLEMKDIDRLAWVAEPPTPDTLRAICLVTLFPNGVAHSRMGFVVICEGKRPVYLDCNKKALKLPQVGWRYEIINPNYNQK